MEEKPSFSERCYAALKKVPAGKITTYKDLAHSIGSRAYRAVGNAMHRNLRSPDVPCHRVIKADGRLGGFALGKRKKIELLLKEGAIINNGKVDLKQFAHSF